MSLRRRAFDVLAVLLILAAVVLMGIAGEDLGLLALAASAVILALGIILQNPESSS